MTTKSKQPEPKQHETGHGGEKQPVKPAEKQSAGKHGETTAKHGETTAKQGDTKQGDTKHGEAAKHGEQRKHADTGAKAGEHAGKHEEATGKQAAPTDKHRPQQESGNSPGNQVEGEGSYTATHRYDEGVRRSVEHGGTQKAAEEARRALDGPEGQILREAEEAAKHGKSMPQQPRH